MAGNDPGHGRLARILDAKRTALPASGYGTGHFGQHGGSELFEIENNIAVELQ